MMVDKRWYAVVYMFAVTAFFSTIIIGASEYTRERVEANQEFAFEEAVLKALGGDIYNKDAAQSELHNRFVERVKKPTDRTAGAYFIEQQGSVKGYALPFEGQGFWAPIKGVIGIKPDKRTVTGIAFYEQNETPGLGAEITTEDWRSQFEGIKTEVESKPVEIKRSGSELEANGVYAVTGATQTSVRVEKMLNDALSEWQQEIGVIPFRVENARGENRK